MRTGSVLGLVLLGGLWLPACDDSAGEKTLDLIEVDGIDTADTDGTSLCPDGAMIEGECFPTDCGSRDCAEGFFCRDYNCTELACVGAICPTGEACAAGSCLPIACTWRNCPALGEVCSPANATA